MENSYFKSKKEIISWVKTVLKLNFFKIEQACTGAIYCQLLDAIYPGKVKMNKVNWKANLEHEFLSNLKILQQALLELNIPNAIDISKLAKGKFQDNFEVLQWLYGYFENKQPDLSRYDAEKRRNYSELSYLNTNANNRSLNNSTYVYTKSRSSSKNRLTSGKLLGFIDKENISGNKKPNCGCNSVRKYNSSTNLFYMISPSTYNKCNSVIKEENCDNNMNNTFDCNDNNTEMMYVNKFMEIYNDVNMNSNIECIRKEYEEKMAKLVEINEKIRRENKTLKIILSDVGKEKDFYLSKLRDFEYLLNKPTSCDKNLFIQIMLDILQSEKEKEVYIDQKGNVVLHEL